MVNYEVVEFDPVSGSAAVRYWSDAVPGGLVYMVDVPVENGEYISGVALDELIRHFAPTAQLERLVEAKVAVVPPELAALIPAPKAPAAPVVDNVPVVDYMAEREAMLREEVRVLVRSTLIELGVISA